MTSRTGFPDLTKTIRSGSLVGAIFGWFEAIEVKLGQYSIALRASRNRLICITIYSVQLFALSRSCQCESEVRASFIASHKAL